MSTFILEYDINSAILLRNWAQQYHIFQHELSTIYVSIDKIYKNQHALFKTETLLARALYGLSNIQIKFSDLIPYPIINILLHLFSSNVKSNLEHGFIHFFRS